MTFFTFGAGSSVSGELDYVAVNFEELFLMMEVPLL